MQYNTYHFTFVSDETGISNRFAGFFSTRRAGLDTVVLVGDRCCVTPMLSKLIQPSKPGEKPNRIQYSLTR